MNGGWLQTFQSAITGSVLLALVTVLAGFLVPPLRRRFMRAEARLQEVSVEEKRQHMVLALTESAERRLAAAEIEANDAKREAVEATGRAETAERHVVALRGQVDRLTKRIDRLEAENAHAELTAEVLRRVADLKDSYIFDLLGMLRKLTCPDCGHRFTLNPPPTPRWEWAEVMAQIDPPPTT